MGVPLTNNQKDRVYMNVPFPGRVKLCESAFALNFPITNALVVVFLLKAAVTLAAPLPSIINVLLLKCQDGLMSESESSCDVGIRRPLSILRSKGEKGTGCITVSDDLNSTADWKSERRCN